MVDFVQHPHILKYKLTSGGDSVQDDDGNWVTPSGSEENVEFECRAVPNKAKIIIGDDGNKTGYDYLVYASPEVRHIADQTEVEIYKKGVKIISGRIRGMFNGQLNSTMELWV